jgi:uncharacterized protein (DUF885 family)
MNGRRQVCLVVIALTLAGCLAPLRAAPATPPPGPTIGPVPTDTAVGTAVNELRGLSFDDFLARSYDTLLVRSPQHVTELGLADQLGMRNDQLDDRSATHLRGTEAMQRAVLGLLRGYDRSALTPPQQLSYDIYAWVLDDLVRAQPFAEHDYLVYQCPGGYHSELLSLLTQSHPMATPQDAADYVARLGRVGEQVAQVLAGLKRREAAGVVPPRFIVDRTLDVLTNYLGTTSRDPAAVDAATLSVYTTFSAKLDGISDLSEGERETLRRQALEAITSSFVPAYMAQLAYLDHLASVATDDAGVWKLPDGDAYYAQLVRRQTTTDLTPDEVYDLGVQQVARVRAELRADLVAMGYPEELELAEMVSRAVADAGSLPMQTQAERDDALRAWKNLIDGADQRVSAAFGLRPAADVVVVGESDGESEGAYYDPAPTDGSADHEVHIGQSAGSQPKFIMPTVAMHEAIPGHHFQVGLAQELDLPLFRKDLRSTAFSEGWAAYAERLSWEMGLYDKDPYGNVGRLVCELIAAARLVADVGIHAKHWTREEAQIYLDDTIGAAPGTFSLEVDRIVVTPAQAVGSDVAMLALLDMRERAKTALGDRFDLKAFHNAVIGHGNLPVSILSHVVDDYVAAELSRKQ